jgi:hypothetical protein
MQKNMMRRIGVFVKSKIEDSSSAILMALKVALSELDPKKRDFEIDPRWQ